ncbi:hypothetical protein EXU48_21400, partial [Occultella glacieicola]
MSASGVVLDLGAGRAVVGDRTIEVAPTGSGGGLRVGGTVLRPLGFGERSRVVAESDAVAPGDVAAVAAAVLAVARSADAGEPARGDEHPRVVFEALALHLAGARTVGRTPGFAEVAALAARGFGWAAEQVLGADADVLDRLVDALVPATDDDAPGWTRIRLDGVAGPDLPTDAGAVRDALARDLLTRAARAYSPDAVAQAPAGVRGPDGTSPRPDVVVPFGAWSAPPDAAAAGPDGGTSPGTPAPPWSRVYPAGRVDTAGPAGRSEPAGPAPVGDGPPEPG